MKPAVDDLREASPKSFNETLLCFLDTQESLSKWSFKNESALPLGSFCTTSQPVMSPPKNRFSLMITNRPISFLAMQSPLKIPGAGKKKKRECQRRLSTVRSRNSESHLRSVIQRVQDKEEQLMAEKEQKLIEAELHRAEVFVKHHNLLLFQQAKRCVDRAEMWYMLIVTQFAFRIMIRRRQVTEAMRTLSFLLGPILQKRVNFRRFAAERDSFVNSLETIPHPSSRLIQNIAGRFFRGWPPHLLDELMSKASMTFVKEGRCLIHAENRDRSMYIITLGSVSVLFKDKALNDKRLNKSNALKSLVLHAPCYVGEYGLICKESRTATIYCDTNVLAWSLTPTDYEQVAHKLSPELRQKQVEVGDERRKDNLRKHSRLRKEWLHALPYFEKWSDTSLNALIDAVEPIVLHNNEFLFRVGELDTAAYFIQDGTLTQINDGGSERELSREEPIGMVECISGIMERKSFSVRSINDCDIWKLSRELLLNVGLADPNALIDCRSAAKIQLANQRKQLKANPSCVSLDPYLNFCLTSSQLSNLYQFSRVSIFLPGETIVHMSSPLTNFVVFMYGTISITLRHEGSRETFRMTNQSPEGDTSELTYEGCRGLTRVFGAFEFASSLPNYCCSVNCITMTEVLILDIEKVRSTMPVDLKAVIKNDGVGGALVTRAYQEQNPLLLMEEKSHRFTATYLAAKRKKGRHNID